MNVKLEANLEENLDRGSTSNKTMPPVRSICTDSLFVFLMEEFPLFNKFTDIISGKKGKKTIDIFSWVYCSTAVLMAFILVFSLQHTESKRC